MSKKILTLTPGVYQLTVPIATSITAYLYGAGGGGGACSGLTPIAFGGGGGFNAHVLTLAAGESILIGVGEGGRGGFVTEGTGVTPYGDMLGSYGGRSLTGFAGAPSGGVSAIPVGADVGTGGGGGGASVILKNNVVLVQAGGGAGAGGGAWNWHDVHTGVRVDRSGTPPNAAVNFDRQTSVYGTEGVASASGGGGGGGTDFIPYAVGPGMGGFNQKDVNAYEWGNTGVSIGFGGVNGSTKLGIRAVQPNGSVSGGHNYIMPGGSPLPSTAGNGGPGGYANSNGADGNDGMVVLELRQDFNTLIKSGITWKELSAPYYKLNGTWVPVTTVFYKDNGAWKKTFSAVAYTLTTLPSSFTTLPLEELISPTVVPPPIYTTPVVPIVPTYTGPQILITPNPLSYSIAGTTYTTVVGAFKIKNTGDQPLIITNMYPTIWRDGYFGPSLITFDAYIPGVGSVIKTYAPGEEVTCDATIYSGYTPTIGTGTPASTLTFISNAIGNGTYVVPISIAVSTPVTVVPSGSQEFFGSGTFTIPAGVTEVTVVMQGPGANGVNGTAAHYTSGHINSGAGGGAGQFKIVTLTGLTPLTTKNVVIGIPGAPTEFGTETAATGVPSTGPTGLGDPGYGGTGGGAAQFYVSGAVAGMSGLAGGGTGSMNSINSSYNVEPGESQGINYINVGANGWSANQPGAGGGGGGLDEGDVAGLGGAGQTGYVKVYWGLASAPVKVFKDYLAGPGAGVVTSGSGHGGDYYYFGSLLGVSGSLSGVNFGTALRYNTVPFTATIAVTNNIHPSYSPPSIWRGVHVTFTALSNCSFSPAVISYGDIAPGATAYQTVIVTPSGATPNGVPATALFQVNAAGTVDGSIDPVTLLARQWITQPEDYTTSFSIQPAPTIVPDAEAGVQGQVICAGVTSPQVVDTSFTITLTVSSVSTSTYLASLWRSVTIQFPTLINCTITPSSYNVGDISVGGSTSHSFTVTPTVADAYSSFTYKAVGIVDNSTKQEARESPLGSASFYVNAAPVYYTPTVDPIGVITSMPEMPFPSNPEINVPFTLYFSIFNIDQGDGFRTYTPSDWQNVSLIFSNPVGCTVDYTPHVIGMIPFAGGVTQAVTFTPTVAGACSIDYIASGTVTGVGGTWSTNGGVPYTASFTAMLPVGSGTSTTETGVIPGSGGSAPGTGVHINSF